MPNESDIRRTMRQLGCERMQAINHLRQRTLLGFMRQRDPSGSLGFRPDRPAGVRPCGAARRDFGKLHLVTEARA